jgi:hypothetical protein
MKVEDKMDNLEIQSFFINWISPSHCNGKINTKQVQKISNEFNCSADIVIECYREWVIKGYKMGIIDKFYNKFKKE